MIFYEYIGQGGGMILQQQKYPLDTLDKAQNKMPILKSHFSNSISNITRCKRNDARCLFLVLKFSESMIGLRHGWGGMGVGG